MRRLIMSIHGKLYLIFVIFEGIYLSMAAIKSDLKLTHLSSTDIWLWSVNGTNSLTVPYGLVDVISCFATDIGQTDVSNFIIWLIYAIKMCLTYLLWSISKQSKKSGMITVAWKASLSERFRHPCQVGSTRDSQTFISSLLRRGIGVQKNKM